jgi:multidrug resistance efflux pump
MLRMVALPVTLWAAVATIAANGQSSSSDTDAFDIEPPLLKQNLSDEPLPGTPEAEVARLEKQLERAKKNAEGAEHLWKIGVLAKVEVEQRLLKVIRCEADLTTARLAHAKEELVTQESQAATNQTSKRELEAAKAAVTQLSEVSQIAAAKRMRAELDAAEANLRRQQKLLKLGSAQKSDVDRAEEKLAKLRSQKN